LVWGFLFDSQKEINKIIKVYDDKGYKCTHFQLGTLPNVSIFRLLWVSIVFIVTLGFIQYWVGPAFLFEKKQ